MVLATLVMLGEKGRTWSGGEIHGALGSAPIDANAFKGDDARYDMLLEANTARWSFCKLFVNIR